MPAITSAQTSLTGANLQSIVVLPDVLASNTCRAGLRAGLNSVEAGTEARPTSAVGMNFHMIFSCQQKIVDDRSRVGLRAALCQRAQWPTMQ